MSYIKRALEDCMEIIDHLMDDIESVLHDEHIEYTRAIDSEIIVKNSDKETVKNCILSIEKLDNEKMNLLLQITESQEKIFIRQTYE